MKIYHGIYGKTFEGESFTVGTESDRSQEYAHGMMVTAFLNNKMPMGGQLFVTKHLR